eukprot:Hpha_TRINITY_DN26680_c0_g1::TRINITY_DN26680_c0_g1_i1::g.86063::m.86063
MFCDPGGMLGMHVSPVDAHLRLAQEMFDLCDTGGLEIGRGDVIAVGLGVHPDAGGERVEALFKQIDRNERDALQYEEFLIFLRALCFAQGEEEFQSRAAAVLADIRAEKRAVFVSHREYGLQLGSLASQDQTVTEKWRRSRECGGGRLYRDGFSAVVAAAAPEISPRRRAEVVRLAATDACGEVPLAECAMMIALARVPPRPPLAVTVEEAQAGAEAARQRAEYAEGQIESMRDRDAQIEALLRENEELRLCSERLRAQLQAATRQAEFLAAQAACQSTKISYQSQYESIQRIETDDVRRAALEVSDQRVSELEQELSQCRMQLHDAEGRAAMQRQTRFDAETDAKYAQGELGTLRAEVQALQDYVERTPGGREWLSSGEWASGRTKACRNADQELAARRIRLGEEGQVLFSAGRAFDRGAYQRLLNSHEELEIRYEQRLAETRRRLHQNMRRVKKAEEEFTRVAILQQQQIPIPAPAPKSSSPRSVQRSPRPSPLSKRPSPSPQRAGSIRRGPLPPRASPSPPPKNPAPLPPPPVDSPTPRQRSVGGEAEVDLPLALSELKDALALLRTAREGSLPSSDHSRSRERSERRSVPRGTRRIHS